tara:strand:+ start:3840 stop:4175 length:336 start_codon:yes stop_codon:yes gene_type:complete
MKNLYILFFSLFFSISVFSQDGLQEKAKKISNEMTMVLSLDEQTSEKIFHIQLKRFIDAQKIRNLYKSDKEMRKVELKKMQNRLWGKLKAVLGKEKMKSWNLHKKNINDKN